MHEPNQKQTLDKHHSELKCFDSLLFLFTAHLQSGRSNLDQAHGQKCWLDDDHNLIKMTSQQKRFTMTVIHLHLKY